MLKGKGIQQLRTLTGLSAEFEGSLLNLCWGSEALNPLQPVDKQ